MKNIKKRRNNGLVKSYSYPYSPCGCCGDYSGVDVDKLMHEFNEKVAKAKNDLLKSILAKHGFCYDDVYQNKIILYAIDSEVLPESHILYIVKDNKVIDCVEIFDKTEAVNNVMTYKTWAKAVENHTTHEDLLKMFNKPDPRQTTLFDMIGEQ